MITRNKITHYSVGSESDWRAYTMDVRDVSGDYRTLTIKALSKRSAIARARRDGYAVVSLPVST